MLEIPIERKEGHMSELLDLVLNTHGGLSERSHVSNRA